MSSEHSIASITCNPANGLITGLSLADRTIPIVSSGFEIGDWKSFASQHLLGGERASVDVSKVEYDASHISCRFRVRLCSGDLEIETNEYLDKGYLIRRYRATALTKSLIGDFVMRLSVPADSWDQAEIQGHKIDFQESNVYHQYAVGSASLVSNNGTILVSDAKYSSAGDRMGAFTYVRDAPNGVWVIHHRLMVEYQNADLFIARVRNTTFSSRSLLSPKHGAFRRLLFGRNERVGLRSPFAILGTIQSQACIELYPGDEFEIFAVTKLIRASDRDVELNPR